MSRSISATGHSCMMSIGKAVTQTLKTMTTQNKGQVADLNGIMKGALKALEPAADGGMSKVMQDLSNSIGKVTKLIGAQYDVMANLKLPESTGGGDKAAADALKDIEATIKRITDENRKQLADLEDLAKEVEDAGKDSGGDKDAAKKVKKAGELLEKAQKLVDEQSKLLDEARKTLAD